MTPGKQPAVETRENDDSSQPEPGRRGSPRRVLMTRELLDKATELFAQKGYESTTLKDVADALGVSRPTMYHYVSSKEELFAMLVEQIGLDLAKSLTELRANTGLTAEQKIRQLTDRVVRQRAEAPTQFRVLDRTDAATPEPLQTRHREARRVVLAELTGVISDGIAAGEFKPLDPQIAAFSILGMCNWVAWWYHPGTCPDIDAVTRQITQSAIDLLVADESRRCRTATAESTLAAIRSDLDALERFLP